jgi:phage replication O-like protein O
MTAAAPQLEDGYTRLANELLEAVMSTGFTQRQLLVILAVIRKTYGYGKKQDDMSAAQLGKLCNMERNHVTEVIGQLVQMQVLTRASGAYGLVLGINKRHSQWVKPAAKKPRTSPDSGLVPTRDESSPNLGQVDSPNLGHTKENLSKENQKKAPREDVTLKAWLAQCEEKGERPVPEDDSIFDYAEQVDLPIDFIRYAWVEFKRKYGTSSKKYKDWRAHFRNAVRENWYGVWFEKDGNWDLTTRGKQIKKELQGKK